MGIAPKKPKDRFSHLSDDERRSLKELAEVERAIAALEGRKDVSPEDVAFARKEEERLRQGLSTVLERTEQNIRQQRRRLILKALYFVLFMILLGAGVVLATPLIRKNLAAREKASEGASRAAAVFLQEGFREVEASTGAGVRVVQGERGKCFVALAANAPGTASVRIERDLVVLEGVSAGFCTCGSEQIRITPVGAEPIELRLLSAPSSKVGGADLMGVLPVPPAVYLAETVYRSCAEEGIDAYIAAHPPIGSANKAGDRVTALGFELVGTVEPKMPVLTIPELKNTCFLAMSDNDEDRLSLRLSGGKKPISNKAGSIALCGQALSGVSLWREGKGTLRLYATPAERVGGLMGMREATERIGKPAELWIASEDLAFDARMMLWASGLSPSGTNESYPEGFPALIGISTDERSMLVVEEGMAMAVCRPPVEVGTVRSLCVQTQKDALGDLTRFPAGSALAKRPTWLPLAKGNRIQNERMLDVLAFARRLSLLGFTLTPLIDFSEAAGNIDVTGRSGEKEIVAISLSASVPYWVPLTDGPIWSIDKEPRIIGLAAGKSIKLRAAVGYLGAKRETLVWRR